MVEILPLKYPLAGSNHTKSTYPSTLIRYSPSSDDIGESGNSHSSTFEAWTVVGEACISRVCLNGIGYRFRMAEPQ